MPGVAQLIEILVVGLCIPDQVAQMIQITKLVT
ncbi:hypothetical protein Cylst_2643 [Cylindrospermum stagnale PCC 7417]|uniref:Uncharacterized protein n=1 Tax=Cylindrospermum stagnale PCC 7417 TaxID=56107 RepID=K9WYG9_9NOST|nr:hypothetical protein Cylst_2643 [Cylindrospermum stagnale PCC 7417]